MTTPQLTNFRKIELNLEDNRQKDQVQHIDGHSYDEVLQIIGLGHIHWMLVLTSGLLLLMVLNETAGMSIIALASQCDLKTNSAQKAWLSSGSFFGILISSFFWGYLTDSVGRRAVLLYATFVGNIITFLSMFMSSLWMLLVSRVFVGIFIAGASSATYAYLCEFFLPHQRPVVVNISSIFVGLSYLYTPLCGWLVLSMNWTLYLSDSFSFRPWRLLLFLNMLPGLIAVLMLWYLPESPKLLFSKHQPKKAFGVLDWICKKHTGKCLIDSKVCQIKLQEEDEPKAMQNFDLTNTKSCFGIFRQIWMDTVPLFKRPHVFNFVLCCTVMFGALLTCSGVGLWFPEIQNRIGAGEDSQTVCQVIDASQKADMLRNQTIDVICDDTISIKTFTDASTLGGIFVIGFLVQCLVINLVGRKNLACLLLTLSGIFGIALNWISEPIALVASFILFLVPTGLCVSVVGGAVIDLVPTQLRGKAVCLAFMFGRAGGIIGINLVGNLIDTYCIETFSTISAFMLVCAVITFAIPI